MGIGIEKIVSFDEVVVEKNLPAQITTSNGPCDEEFNEVILLESISNSEFTSPQNKTLTIL